MAVSSDVLKRTLSPTMSLVIIVGLSVIWGYHWAVMKIGLYYCGGLTYTAIRCILAVPLMLLIVKLRGGSIRNGSRTYPRRAPRFRPRWNGCGDRRPCIA